jgi:hypothetical protein
MALRFSSSSALSFNACDDDGGGGGGGHDDNHGDAGAGVDGVETTNGLQCAEVVLVDDEGAAAGNMVLTGMPCMKISEVRMLINEPAG